MIRRFFQREKKKRYASLGLPMAAAKEIDQKLVFVTHEQGKLSSFRRLVGDGTVQPPTLVFVQTIER